MSVPKLESQARAFYVQAINKKNLAIIEALLAPDFIDHEDLGTVEPNRDGVKMFLGMLISAFPDLKVTVDDMISDGDKVVLRSTWMGTHEGEFMGIPATGKKVTYSGIDILKFTGDLVSEHWGLSDSMKMMAQLGLLPEAS